MFKFILSDLEWQHDDDEYDKALHNLGAGRSTERYTKK